MDLPYLRYYGLKEEPFSTVPSPRYLFLTAPSSSMALRRPPTLSGPRRAWQRCLATLHGKSLWGATSPEIP